MLREHDFPPADVLPAIMIVMCHITWTAHTVKGSLTFLSFVINCYFLREPSLINNLEVCGHRLEVCGHRLEVCGHYLRSVGTTLRSVGTALRSVGTILRCGHCLEVCGHYLEVCGHNFLRSVGTVFTSCWLAFVSEVHPTLGEKVALSLIHI